MMNHNSETMTRLIDGELSDLERFDFLSAVDEEGAEDWRIMALGLLERQLITDGLSQLEAQTHEEKAPLSRNKAKTPWLGSWAMRAALILLGVGLGFSGPHLIGGKSAEIASGDPSGMSLGDESLDSEITLAALEEARDTPIRAGYITANFRDGRQLIVPVSYIADQNQ